MDPQLFAQMNKMMGGKFDNMDEEQQKQAGNIWKMLDDMAQNNPDGYKSFVDSNIKEGFKELKKEKEEKIKEQKVLPQVGFLIKTQANLKTQILNKEEIPIYQKLNVNENNVQDYHQFKSKCDKEVKFYINVMFHPRVKGPLKADMQPVDKFEDVKSWKIVPVSVSQVASRKSESYGTNVYFVDTVLNDKVYNFMNSQVGLQVSLIQFVTDRVQEQIKLGFNPLMESYNPADVNELLYYQFEKVSLKRHTKKKYKPADKKLFNENKVQSVLLEPKYDLDYEKFSENDKQEKQPEINLNNPEELLKQYKDLSGNDTNNNNSSNSEKQGGIPQKQEEKVLDGLKLISKSEQEQKLQQKDKKIKKPLIQELSSTVIDDNEEQKQENTSKIEQKIPQQQEKYQQQPQKQQQQQTQKQQKQKQENSKIQEIKQNKQQEKQEILTDAQIEEKVQIRLQIEAQKLIKQQQQQLEQKIQEPVFNLIDNPQNIVIDIELPLVKSFKQINLDISSKELKLDVIDTYKLNILFSESINNDAIKAKWEKKTKCLKLNLPKFY